MQHATFTKPAQTRAQRLGIRTDVAEALLAYGTARVGHSGAEVLYMDKAARQTARKVMGPKAYARLADRLDCYIVVASDGDIIACAHRTERLRFKH